MAASRSKAASTPASPSPTATASDIGYISMNPIDGKMAKGISAMDHNVHSKTLL